MATTPQRSKRGFDFATSPKSDDAQYFRREIERVVKFLLEQINELRSSIVSSPVSDSTITAAQLNVLQVQINNLALLVSSIPQVDTSSFLTSNDLFPIVVPLVFSGTISIASNQTAVFFDETEVNGTITNNGKILVLE